MLLLPLLAQADNDGYVETDQWHVSLAIGLGQKSNPLIGGEDLPLVILPEIAYYGESVYFDNGDLGYTFVDNETFSFGILARLNIERAFFSRLHPSNILISAQVADQVTSGEVCIDCTGEDDTAFNVSLPSIDDLSKRKYAIDAGVSFVWHVSDSAMLSFELMQDVSSVYKGQNAQIEYSQRQRIGELKLGASVGLRFKSQKQIDYYYGLDEQDSVNPIFFYRAKAAVQPYVKLTGIYPLSEKWSLVGLARVSHLGSAMTDSPVVEDNVTSTVYLGASYEF